MRIRTLIVLCLLACLAGCSEKFKDFKEESSYALGVDIMRNLERQQIPVKAADIRTGILEADLETPKFTPEEIEDLMLRFNLFMQSKNNPQAQKPEIEEDFFMKVGYAIGLDIIKNLSGNGIDLDSTFVAKGMVDEERKKVSLPDDRIKEIISTLQNKITMEQTARLKAMGDKNKLEGAKFLEENGKKEGVKATASGLQYKILKKGTGKKKASLESSLKIHYSGKLLSGKEFDSSYKRGKPMVFPSLNGLIGGWKEAIPMMREGDVWELYIPSDLAYGEQGRMPNIEPNSVLIFQVELLEIDPKPETGTK